MFHAINSLMTKWPHLISGKCQNLLDYHYKYIKKKKVTQRNNYQRYLRIETKYIECIAGKAEAFFFKAFAQTSYNLKRNMNAGLYKI